MNTKHPIKLLGLCLLLSTLSFPPSILLAQGTAFTYQGRLNDGANPVKGSPIRAPVKR